METIIPRIIQSSKQSFFLFGPRGTGKTTWLKATFPEALFIDLLKQETFRSLSARPERIRELVMAQAPTKRIVVIDEVQKLPELLSEVHHLMEEKIGVQFVLTGSSSRKLKRTGVDLLAGRALRLEIYPFMATELGGTFDLEKALRFGLIPLVVRSASPQKVLDGYAALYVREEVQMEGLVRNIGNFSRFLEGIAFSHGSILNISNVARECEVERKTVEGYISILEDLLLAYRIPVFSKRAKRALVVHPKFYYFDAGVYRALRPKGPLDRPEEIDGAALEGLVLQHLIAWKSYRSTNDKIYFWRTPSGNEVDFIVYGSNVFSAIEVKNSPKVRNEDLKPLLAFKEDYPECKTYLLYRGKERLLKSGVTCMPCEEFLRSLEPAATI